MGEKNKQVHCCHRSIRHLHASVETIGQEKLVINSACCIPKNHPGLSFFQDTAWIVAGSRACSGNEVEWTAWPRLRLKPNQPMQFITPTCLTKARWVARDQCHDSLPSCDHCSPQDCQLDTETSCHQGITRNPDVKMIEK